MTDFRVDWNRPPIASYLNLRRAVGWPAVAAGAVRLAFERTLLFGCVAVEERLVGFGRAVGDAGLYVYVQDVMVDPEFQRQGIGTALTVDLLRRIESSVEPCAFVGLLAIKGTEPFYEGLGMQSLSLRNTPMEHKLVRARREE